MSVQVHSNINILTRLGQLSSGTISIAKGMASDPCNSSARIKNGLLCFHFQSLKNYEHFFFFPG